MQFLQKVMQKQFTMAATDLIAEQHWVSGHATGLTGADAARFYYETIVKILTCCLSRNIPLHVGTSCHFSSVLLIVRGRTSKSWAIKGFSLHTCI